MFFGCHVSGMHVKITTSGPRRYVQVVESLRDDDGRIRKRTVATLGRLDQVGDSLDAVINGLLKATGRTSVLGDSATADVRFDSARVLGKAASTGLSPDRALEQLTRIQHHRIQIAQTQPVTGVSTIAKEQAEIFSALCVRKPVASQQLSLLWWSVLNSTSTKTIAYSHNCRTRVVCLRAASG